MLGSAIPRKLGTGDLRQQTAKSRDVPFLGNLFRRGFYDCFSEPSKSYRIPSCNVANALDLRGRRLRSCASVLGSFISLAGFGTRATILVISAMGQQFSSVYSFSALFPRCHRRRGLRSDTTVSNVS